MKIKFIIKEKPHILWLYLQYNYNIWGLWSYWPDLNHVCQNMLDLSSCISALIWGISEVSRVVFDNYRNNFPQSSPKSRIY